MSVLLQHHKWIHKLEIAEVKDTSDLRGEKIIIQESSYIYSCINTYSSLLDKKSFLITSGVKPTPSPT